MPIAAASSVVRPERVTASGKRSTIAKLTIASAGGALCARPKAKEMNRKAHQCRKPWPALISALVGAALFPTAILFLLWQGPIRPTEDSVMPPADALSTASMPSSTRFAPPIPVSTAPDIALSSPKQIEAKAGEEINFPIAIDATEKLPSHCIIAVSAMPEGALFSEGRPDGPAGWSLRPEAIGELRLRLPGARSGASDMRIELLAADGAVLAQAKTRLTIAADPTESEPASVVESAPPEQTVQAVAPNFAASTPPPQRRPASSAKTERAVKIASVKTVAIKPPGATGRHDGALALGPAPESPAEWVEIVRPVNMRIRPRQSAATVKITKKGLKLRVTARDKKWVQVNDPATSTKGWIYSRFLKPTEPPAQ